MVTAVIRYQEEAHSLIKIAQRVSAALKEPFSIIVICKEGCKELSEVDENTPKWVRAFSGLGAEILLHCGGKTRYETVEKYLREKSSSLVLLGKHLRKKNENENTEFSRHLFQVLPSQVLLVRMGNQDVSPEAALVETLLAEEAESAEEEKPFPILVACGHGSHTRRALRIAKAVAGKNLVALHIAPNVDPESSSYAKHSLNGIINKAGLDPSVVVRKTVLTENLTKALREEIMNGHEGHPYAMLLLGESQNQGLKEKLFGTVPDTLVNKEKGLTIGVIRAEKPVGHRMKDTLARLIRVRFPQLTRDDRISLFGEIENMARWTFDFAALMTLAAMVAGLGLLANSGAVVIGAMLLAPLMMPLIGSGLALSQGNTPLFKRSLSAVVRGFLAALITGILLGLIGRFFQIPLTEELAARGNPTLLDLGVAFVSGIAAAYCISRPNLSGALAGVAIAAALVPPIVTTGICLTMGHLSVSKGAGLLFGTNVVAVIFGSALNFTAAGIRGQGEAGETGRRFIFIFALACLGLAFPLTSVLLKKIPNIEEIIEESAPLTEYEHRVEKVLPEGVTLGRLKREGVGTDKVHYEVTVESSEPLSEEAYEALKAALDDPERTETFRVKTEIIRGDVKEEDQPSVSRH